MQAVLDQFPSARRALFRRYHIGGCSSCGFQPSETLAELCRRNDNLDVQEVIDHILQSQAQDQALLIAPAELAAWRESDPSLKLVDIRSREEFDAARIDRAVLLSQELMQEALGRWPKDSPFVIIDHDGRQGLDAAAYFLGHGFQKVRCLRGGIDAWSQEIDSNVPRYRLS